MTALIDTLFQIEKQLGIELDSLLPYAEADTIGGYHPEESKRKWWTGAIWEVEGQTLYAVIRALKPQTIVEIGSGTGCSSTHMALALYNNQKANNELLKTDSIVGHITTVDRGNTPQIPDFLQPYVTIEAGDGINYLALLPDNSVDFILEDADHTTDMCHAIGELAKTKLKPGGVLFVHDIEHFAVGAEVRAGYDLAGMEVRRYRTDPSDCGWGVWQKPKADYSPVIDTTVLQAQEEPNAQPWTPATLSDGQIEALNLDAKWQAEKNAQPTPYVDHLETLDNGEIVEVPKWIMSESPILQAQEEPNAKVTPDATYMVNDEPVTPTFAQPKRTAGKRKAKSAK